MTQSRRTQISLASTPFYHCVSRCVRRGFLCGRDSYSGINYEHRRQWILDTLNVLQEVFCIDLCAYAIMSNHYHVVVFVDESAANNLTMDEVIERWTTIYKGPDILHRYQAGDQLTLIEQEALSTLVEVWRERLKSISWFMGRLNESIARQANAEDKCKGRFWEGRFKCKAILDDAALINNMVYVDLNPIRAKMAETPEESDFTSLQKRIRCYQMARLAKQSTAAKQPEKLLKLVAVETIAMPNNVIHIGVKDYLALVDWTGRAIRDGKRGSIPVNIPGILERLNTDPERWLDSFNTQKRARQSAFGAVVVMREYCESIKKQWLWGMARPGY